MAIRYRQFVENEKKLAEALQTLTRQERGELPVQLQTPAERRKSAADARAVERSVERSIERDRRYQRRVKNISCGQY